MYKNIRSSKTVGNNIKTSRHCGLDPQSPCLEPRFATRFSGLTRLNLANLFNLAKITVLTIAFLGLSLGFKVKAQTVIDSGSCGANLTWVLTSDSVLTISGSGAMADYAVINYSINTPWYFHIRAISTVKIGNSVTTIGNYAFSNCSGLTSITIPNSVTSIGMGAFRGSGLVTIIIPNSVKSIKSLAFSPCISLISINVDNNNSTYSSIDGILYNKIQDTLILCPQGRIERVVIPNTVTVIEDYAFSGCHNLDSIMIDDNVTWIGGHVFANCSNLKTVTIGKGVTQIGQSAFYYCSNLQTVNYNAINFTGMMGTSVFLECHAFTTLNIGNQVKMMPIGAFDRCTNLTSITIHAIIPPVLGNSPFQYVPKNIPVHVPCGSIPAYQTATGWSDFTNFIEMELSLPTNLSVMQTNNSFSITWQGYAESYQIYRNGDSLTTVSTTSYTDNDLTDGEEYCYQIKAINEDCESEFSDTVCQTFNSVGIAETQCIASLRVYPNPTNNQLIVEIAGQARNDVWNIEIYDIFGRTVLSKEVSNDKTMVDMSNLSSGVYILRVESKDKIVGRKKIIKQ